VVLSAARPSGRGVFQQSDRPTRLTSTCEPDDCERLQVQERPRGAGHRPRHTSVCRARSVRYRGKSPAGKALVGSSEQGEHHRYCKGQNHGFFCRTFLIARDDTLWRLSSTSFDRMLRGSGRTLSGRLCGAASENGQRRGRACGQKPGARRSEHVFHSYFRCRRSHRPE